jgi:hypothetical protein
MLAESFTDMSLEGRTTITVSGVPDLIQCYFDRNDIILSMDKKFVFENSKLQFAYGEGAGLYYRGVRVYDQPSLYTWNFLKDIELTEDRTIKALAMSAWTWDQFIERDLHDEKVLYDLLLIKFEKLDPRLETTVVVNDQPTLKSVRPIEQTFLSWYAIPQEISLLSEAYKNTVCKLYQRDPVAFKDLRHLVREINPELINAGTYKMSPREQMMLNKAKELVALFGFATEIEYVPISVQELGADHLGLYSKGEIILSPKLFDQGTKQLVATLYEECYHHRTANKDLTYGMQNDLFNIIISLNEELHNVIC